jgi:hypothetical protein
MYRVCHDPGCPSMPALERMRIQTAIDQTIQDLKRAIRDETVTINQELMRRVLESFVYLMNLCNKTNKRICMQYVLSHITDYEHD